MGSFHFSLGSPPQAQRASAIKLHPVAEKMKEEALQESSSGEGASNIVIDSSGAAETEEVRRYLSGCFVVDTQNTGVTHSDSFKFSRHRSMVVKYRS